MNLRNRRTLLFQASSWAWFDGFTAVFLSAFALALGASNTTIGFLAAIPFISHLLTQFVGINLSQAFPRKKVYTLSTTISRLWWVGILFSPFLSSHPIPFVVIFYFFSRFFVGLSAPSFNTLLADSVEKEHRGEFFSKRFKLLGIFGAVAVLIGGVWLKFFPKDDPYGFSVMFGVGIVIGIAASLSILRIEEPEYRDHSHHTVREFVSLKGTFGKFVLFSVIFCFAFNLASALFTVYILKNLGMGYEWFAIVAGTVTIAKVIASKKVGELSDTFGDKPITTLGIIGTAIIPLAYVFITPSLIWLVIPVSLLSGFSWAAADIGRFNLLIGLTDPEKEGLQMAEHNFYSSIPLAIAPWIGGYISENFSGLMLTGIPLVFVVSSLLRFASVGFLQFIKEPRNKKVYSAGFVFKQILQLDGHSGHSVLAHFMQRIRKRR